MLSHQHSYRIIASIKCDGENAFCAACLELRDDELQGELKKLEECALHHHNSTNTKRKARQVCHTPDDGIKIQNRFKDPKFKHVLTYLTSRKISVMKNQPIMCDMNQCDDTWRLMVPRLIEQSRSPDILFSNLPTSGIYLVVWRIRKYAPAYQKIHCRTKIEINNVIDSDAGRTFGSKSRTSCRPSSRESTNRAHRHSMYSTEMPCATRHTAGCGRTLRPAQHTTPIITSPTGNNRWWNELSFTLRMQ